MFRLVLDNESNEACFLWNDAVPPAINFPTGSDPASAFALQKRFNRPGMSPPVSA